jgi:hypothetical protein
VDWRASFPSGPHKIPRTIRGITEVDEDGREELWVRSLEVEEEVERLMKGKRLKEKREVGLGRMEWRCRKEVKLAIDMMREDGCSTIALGRVGRGREITKFNLSRV